jgi:hypothetical protein
VFTFVMFHHSPYSAGVHGDPDERQSSYPTRVLDDLFHKYGVAAVFNGHDHINQRSHTVRNGREMPYLTSTASQPRGNENKSGMWLSDNRPKFGLEFLERSNRTFVLGNIKRSKDGKWLARLAIQRSNSVRLDGIAISRPDPAESEPFILPSVTSSTFDWQRYILLFSLLAVVTLPILLWQRHLARKSRGSNNKG